MTDTSTSPAFLQAVTAVNTAIERLHAAGGDAASPGQRTVRAEIIDEFGLPGAQAVTLAYLIEHQFHQHLTNAIGPDRAETVRSGLRESVAHALADGAGPREDV